MNDEGRIRRVSGFGFGAFTSSLLVGLLLLAPVRGEAQTPIAPDFKLKAVFLYNFVQFVDWPPHAFSDPEAPIVIGVLGPDPFGTVLDETVRDEVIKNRKLEVRRYARVEQVEGCHVLYISDAEQHRLEQILARLRNKPILTVGDIPGFAHRGGMIHFGVQRNKIKLTINPETAAAAELTVSTKLLRLADVVPAGE